MTVGHVFARPSVFVIVLLTLLLDSTSNDANHNLNHSILVRRISSQYQQRKLPIMRWSKRGVTTIAMPDNQCIVAVDVILLCGDVHPQPGPSAHAKRGSNESRTQTTKPSACQATKNRKHLMSVAHLNVRSLASRENFHLLKQTVTSTNYDIFTISESWLDSTVCDADIQIPGYTPFRQDRGAHKRGGGLVVYVKNIFKASVIEKWSTVFESNFQQLWLKVQCKKFKSFLLCTAYRPPDTPKDFLETLSEAFDNPGRS